MRKGFSGSQLVTVLSNAGTSDYGRSMTLTNTMTGFNPGDLVTDLISCNDTYVDNNGNLVVTRKAGSPIVLYAKANIRESSICVNGTTTNPNIVAKDPKWLTPVLNSASTTSPIMSTPTSIGLRKSSPVGRKWIIIEITLFFMITGHITLIVV
jgi:hypothetical protein